MLKALLLLISTLLAISLIGTGCWMLSPAVALIVVGSLLLIDVAAIAMAAHRNETKKRRGINEP